MDYAIDPTTNLQPDASNFLYLADLYGRPPPSSSTDSSGTRSTALANDDGKRRKRDLVDSRLDRSDVIDNVQHHYRILHADNYMEVHFELMDGNHGVYSYYLLA